MLRSRARGVGHRISVVKFPSPGFEKLTRDRSEKDAPIDIGDLTQLVRVEVAQLLLEALQAFLPPRQSRAGCSPRSCRHIDETPGHALERPGGQIAAGEIERKLVEIGVGFPGRKVLRRRPGRSSALT